MQLAFAILQFITSSLKPLFISLLIVVVQIFFPVIHSKVTSNQNVLDLS